MDAARIIWLALGILAAQAVVWVPIILRMRWQRNSFAQKAREAGETIVLGPERADYQGWVKRFGYAQTMGILALTDRRILFKRPIGNDISIPMSEIASVSDTATLGKLRHTTMNYFALTLRDGVEVVFWVSHQDRWLSEMRQRLGPVAEPPGL